MSLVEARADFLNSDFSQNPVFLQINPDMNPLSRDISLIEQRVFGQTQAAESVARAAIRVKAGLTSRGRPEYIGFFLGAPGTGKTEMGSAISQLYWGDEWEQHVKKINCAAFNSEYSVSSLIGAPTGYIGWGTEAGLLIGPKLLSERNVIIFDEVEKAHPQLLKVALGILEGGKLEVPLETGEGKDKKVKNVELDFSKSSIVFTSNISSFEIGKKRAGKDRLGFNHVSEEPDVRKSAFKALRDFFRGMPEFLDRIPAQNIVVFNPLTYQVKERIYEKFMKELVPSVNGSLMVISTSELRKWVIEKCDPAEGARPLRDKITELVVDPLALVKLTIPANVPVVAGVDLEKDEGEVVFWVNKSFLGCSSQ